MRTFLDRANGVLVIDRVRFLSFLRSFAPRSFSTKPTRLFFVVLIDVYSAGQIGSRIEDTTRVIDVNSFLYFVY